MSKYLATFKALQHQNTKLREDINFLSEELQRMIKKTQTSVIDIQKQSEVPEDQANKSHWKLSSETHWDSLDSQEDDMSKNILFNKISPASSPREKDCYLKKRNLLIN